MTQDARRPIDTDAHDPVQHGIDDDPNNDGTKALGLGAIGGGAVGAIAGSALGPAGAIAGAAIGGSIGSLASGAAVDAVDAFDNDDTITGIGEGQTRDLGDQLEGASDTNTQTVYTDPVLTSGTPMDVNRLDDIGNDIPGIQTGGTTIDGAPDTRGLTEKTADAVTGDNWDDKTGRRVDY